MRNEKGEITIKSIYKWLRSEKGKRYSFAIFYIIFFIVLFLFFMMPADHTFEEKEQEVESENQSSLPFKTLDLEDKDYQFTYQEINDLETITYNGLKSNDKISITSESETFEYSYQRGQLIKNSEDLEARLYNFQLLDIYEIKRVLKNATLISETKLISTNEMEYNYEIKLNLLQEILNSEITSSQADVKITVQASPKNELTKINFEIKEQEETKNYNITIDYGVDNE